MRTFPILLILLFPLSLSAQDSYPEPSCPYKDIELTDDSLTLILQKHCAWLKKNKHSQENCQNTSSPPEHANLCAANLALTNLSLSNLQYANLSEANLSGASFTIAYLEYADLTKANLSGATFVDSNLTNTDLTDANLSGARFLFTDLSGALYEPLPGKFPDIDTISTAVGLSKLTYSRFPRGLYELRKKLKVSGYDKIAQRITYAIHHARSVKQIKEDSWIPKIKGFLNQVGFELTTKWGMEPERALLFLVAFIPVFTLAYAVSLWSPKSDGIWRIWSKDRVRKDLGSDEPELISARGFGAIKLAFYFSLLSAFHIGWRDLNVGNWISRIQPREYTFRASGWARTVAGLQSLLSVYLLAMWALTTFGSPFG